MEQSYAITKIERQQRSDSRVSVYVNGTYAFSLTYDQVLQTKIKKDLEITSLQLEEFKKISDRGKIRARALEWALNRPRSESELKGYLIRKKADKEGIAEILEEFKIKKYINEEQFASWLADTRGRKNKSSRAIRAELQSKGISSETIQSIAIKQAEHSDTEAIVKLVNKLRKRTKYQDDKKLIPYLLSKGFYYEDIKHTLQDLGDTEQE